MPPELNSIVRLKGKTQKAKNHLANFGDVWQVKHPTGSKHEGTFLVACGQKFEAMWLGPDYEIIEEIDPLDFQ